MKAYVIQSGHFSKAGNFIGISALGERVHIYKKDITRLFPEVGIVYRCLGRYEKELVKFPFYCMADHLTFDSTHGTTFTRLTATEVHSSDDAIKAKLELNSTIEYYERELKHYRTELADTRRRLETYRESYDDLAKEHDALVAKVEHFNVEGEIGDYIRIANNLKEENEELKDEIHSLQWDNNFIQSERERLALLLINTTETLMSCDLGLSQEKINQLINNA